MADPPQAPCGISRHLPANLKSQPAFLTKLLLLRPHGTP
jgi:hypothetical protein